MHQTLAAEDRGLDPHLDVEDYAPVFSAALGALRTRVLQRMRAMGARTLAVVSPGPGEGRTLLAAHLARSMAASQERQAVLVDADLRNPGQHHLWGMENGPGLAQVLSGTRTLESALVRPGPERLELLRAGEDAAEAIEWLGSERMAALLGQLTGTDRSRHVVIDLAPLLGAGDALAVLPRVGAVLMVVEDDRSSLDDLASAERLLEGMPLIGLVLNRSAQHVPGRLTLQH